MTEEDDVDDRIWVLIADAGRARILELCKPGEPPRVVEELTDESDEAKRFARQLADRLEEAYSQARFEFLRIAAAPRFLAPLRAEIDKHLDLSRAVLDWRALEPITLDDAQALQQMGPADLG